MKNHRIGSHIPGLVIISNERHLMRVMGEYVRYYNRSRTHLPPGKRSPDGRPPEPPFA